MKQFFSLLVCVSLYMGSSLSAAQSAPKPSDAKALGKELMSNLSGIFSLDQQNTERLDGRDVPALRNGNWVMSSHPIPLVNSFTAQTDAIAAIFVKVGDEFIRLMTTEANEKAGTVLDHAHPAYKRLHGELRYTDKVTLSGKEYMADYDVFRDRQGRVIGAYLVGIPL
jgi:methyl-accepting chemotaxis protein